MLFIKNIMDSFQLKRKNYSIYHNRNKIIKIDFEYFKWYFAQSVLDYRQSLEFFIIIITYCKFVLLYCLWQKTKDFWFVIPFVFSTTSTSILLCYYKGRIDKDFCARNKEWLSRAVERFHYENRMYDKFFMNKNFFRPTFCFMTNVTNNKWHSLSTFFVLQKKIVERLLCMHIFSKLNIDFFTIFLLLLFTICCWLYRVC